MSVSKDADICKDHRACVKVCHSDTKDHDIDATFKYNLSINNVKKLSVQFSTDMKVCNLHFIDVRKTRTGTITFTCKDDANNIFFVPAFLVKGYERKDKIAMPWEFA